MTQISLSAPIAKAQAVATSYVLDLYDHKTSYQTFCKDNSSSRKEAKEIPFYMFNSYISAHPTKTIIILTFYFL
jgi:hypothetical protein